MTFVKVHNTPDGNFPNGIPNPLLPECRDDTRNAVIEHGADMGIASGGGGLGIPFGKLPSGVLCTLAKVTGTFGALKRASSASTTGPAAPLPELITSFSGLRFATLM